MNEVWLKEGSDTVYSFEPVDLPADTVRIHYQRQDQNYDPYGLWIWGDDVARLRRIGRRGYHVPFRPNRPIWRLCGHSNEAGAQKINFLVLDPAKGDAGKDGGDKGFSLVDRYQHLFIQEGDNTVSHPRMGKCLPG